MARYGGKPPLSRKRSSEVLIPHTLCDSRQGMSPAGLIFSSVNRVMDSPEHLGLCWCNNHLTTLRLF